MTEAQCMKALRPLLAEWPCGELVWHKASGKRGVIAGYRLYADATANLMVDYGDGNYSAELPVSLSATRVSDGTDGDEWKDGKEGV